MDTTETKLDWRVYYQVLSRHRTMILVFFVGAVALAAMKAFTTPPVYEASSVVLIENRSAFSEGVDRFVPRARGRVRREEIATLQKLVTSRTCLLRLIDELDMRSKSSIVLKAKEVSSKFPDMSHDGIVEMLLVNKLRRKIEVRYQRRTEYIEIVAQSTSPQEAYEMSLRLTHIFMEEMRKKELGGVRGAIEFNSVQLEKYHRQLQESEEKLRRFKQGVVVSGLDRNGLDPTNLDPLKALLASSQSELRRLEDNRNLLKARIGPRAGQISLRPSAEFLKVKSATLEKITTLSEMMLRFSWRDAEVLRINSEIDRLRDALVDEVDALVAQQLRNESTDFKREYSQYTLAQLDVEFLNKKISVYNGLIGIYKRQVANAPGREIQLARLQQEVDMNRELYTMFLQQMQGSEITEAARRNAAAARLRLIEPAKRPIYPVSPGKRKVLTMGCIFGLGLGLGMAFTLEYFDKSFKAVDDVESYLGLPVVGTIPRMVFLPGGTSGVRKVVVPTALIIVIVSAAVAWVYLNK